MPHPLDATGYVDDAVDALAQTNVFVSPEVDGSAELANALEQQIGDASIGVAVFSDNAALEASNEEILMELAESTPYDTIIVAVGDDLFAGSRVIVPAGEAMRIANEAEQSAGSVDAALAQTVEQISAAIPEPAPDPGGGDAGLGFGLAVGAAVLVSLGVATFGVVRALLRRRRHPLPEPVRASVARLRALTGEYSLAETRGVSTAGDVADEVAEIATNTTELFERLGRRGDEPQRAIAAVEYGDTLRKLTAALDREYLLDILTHPHLWDEPADRVREVREAIAAVQRELVDNIKQLNARQGLHFQVSLDGLIGRRKELQEWERAFESADDEP